MDRATKSSKFMNENKYITPVLGITMLVVTRSYFGSQNTAIELIIENFTQIELGMI